MTPLISPQLGCLLEQFFPFLRPCWIPAVLRSQQNKAGEMLTGGTEGSDPKERDLLMKFGLRPAVCYLAVLQAGAGAGTSLTKTSPFVELNMLVGG